MIHFYRSHFQIEFTFRDVKQYWGLEDFMSIKQTQVKNAANLSMFMVNFSRVIASQIQDADSTSTLDLKAHFQGLFYLEQVLKIDPQIQKVISFEKLQNAMTDIGRIHSTQKETIIQDKILGNSPLHHPENGEKDMKLPERAKGARRSFRSVASFFKFVTKIAS